MAERYGCGASTLSLGIVNLGGGALVTLISTSESRSEGIESVVEPSLSRLGLGLPLPLLLPSKRLGSSNRMFALDG